MKYNKWMFVLPGVLASVMYFSLANSQVLGTNRLLSQTQFCVKYNCKYVKVEKSGPNSTWNYYLSERFNFDAIRYDASETFNSLDAVVLRFKGNKLTLADAKIVNDLIFSLVGLKIINTSIIACSQANYIELFRKNEGYTSGVCQKTNGPSIEFTFTQGGV